MKIMPILLTITMKTDSDIVDSISLNSGKIKQSLGFDRVETMKNHIEFCESELYPRIVVDNKKIIITMPNTNVISDINRSNYDVLREALSSFELLEKDLIIEKLNLTGIIEESNKLSDMGIFFNKGWIDSIKSLNNASFNLDYYNKKDEHFILLTNCSERCWVDLGLSKLFPFKDIDEHFLDSVVDNVMREMDSILGIKKTNN